MGKIATNGNSAESVCDDEADNDQDGLYDCDDTDCFNNAFCTGSGNDGDGDGYSDGADCDDSDSSVFPGAPEITNDGIDQNCDGQDDTTSIISSIEPSFGSTVGGSQVVISGGPFDNGTAAYFDGIQAPIFYQSSTSISVGTPTVATEGSVDVVGQQVLNRAWRLLASHFSDGYGLTGAIGWLSHIPPWILLVRSSLDEGYASISFIAPQDVHAWELVTPSIDSCSPTTYSYGGTLDILDLQEPTLNLQGPNGVSIPLSWDSTAAIYSSSTLNSSSLPDNTTFDLLPFSGLLQDFEVNGFANTSQAPILYTPALQGMTPVNISQNQTFTWSHRDDWISIQVSVMHGLVAILDQINCIAVDDGEFTIKAIGYNGS